MNEKLKPLITLSEINALPDGHLHSKISYLKSIINEEQNPQTLDMRHKMYKMSYTIKNIGIHGQQIGITSKRMPLKTKLINPHTSQINLQKNKQLYIKKYLPQHSFYSQALIPIRKKKQTDQDQNSSNNPFLVTSSNFMANQFSHTSFDANTVSKTKFSKKMNKSTKLIKNFSHSINSNQKLIKRQDTEKQKQLIQKINSVRKTHSQHKIASFNNISNRKSFAKILNQCHTDRKQMELVPLQHQQNPMFKKIKKLQTLVKQRKHSYNMHTQSARGISRGSSIFAGKYHAVIQTARNIDSRNTISRNK